MTIAETTPVVLIPSRYVAPQFEEVAAQLHAAGVSVRMYESAVAALADTKQLAATKVMLGMHNFPLSRQALTSMPNLRAALSFITGTEGFDEVAATDLGILIANGQIAENFHSMAEATIMLMLAAFYDLRGAESALRQNNEQPEQFRAAMLMGKTVGILGFGRIAQAIAERLTGWGVRLQVSTRRADVILPNIRNPGVMDRWRERWQRAACS